MKIMSGSNTLSCLKKTIFTLSFLSMAFIVSIPVNSEPTENPIEKIMEEYRKKVPFVEEDVVMEEYIKKTFEFLDNFDIVIE